MVTSVSQHYLDLNLQEIYVVLESDEDFWADSEPSMSDEEGLSADEELSAAVSINH